MIIVIAKGICRGMVGHFCFFGIPLRQILLHLSLTLTGMRCSSHKTCGMISNGFTMYSAILAISKSRTQKVNGLDRHQSPPLSVNILDINITRHG